MYMHSKPVNKQAGIVLLEGLIAILIFSLGILAIVGMQSMAVKQVTDAKYRSEASLLVNQLLGTMWASNRTATALQTKFNTGGDGYNAWLADVSAALPGINANPPTVVVDNQGVVTITVHWLAPNEALLPDGSTAAAHKYITVAQIK